MSARVDYAAEAMSVLKAVGTTPMTSGAAVASAVAALTHATLAIVEQQRIATLIAYVHLLETQYAEAARHSAEFDWKTREESVARHGIALARIREGLGL